jgi:hypothetical protein
MTILGFPTTPSPAHQERLSVGWVETEPGVVEQLLMPMTANEVSRMARSRERIMRREAAKFEPVFQ